MAEPKYCCNYGKSDELKIIYGDLFSGKILDEFIKRSASLCNLQIETDFSIQAEHIQKLEPDFELRQFLWFLRPAANFRAFKEAVESWRLTTQALIGGENRDIPFSSLLKTAKKIQGCIDRYSELKPKSALFPKFEQPIFAEKDRVQTHHLNVSNPMLGNGCASYPLYTIVLNHLKLLNDSIYSSDIQEKTRAYSNHCNALLTGYIYICATDRRITPPSKKSADKTKKREDNYQSPYSFLSQDVQNAPDTSKLNDLDRMIRTMSVEWTSYDPLHRKLLEKLIDRPYKRVVRSCYLYVKKESKGNSKGNASINLLMPIFKFFSETRRIQGNFGNRGDPNGPGDRPTGNYCWTIPPSFINQEEDVYGNIVDVFQLPNAPISKERIKELEKLGEDPNEDSHGEPMIEVLFMGEGNSFRLKLDKHTSHSQLLQASKNQELWWNKTACTDLEMKAFLSFIRSKNGLAPQVLLMVAILAIDLEMALSLEIWPTQEEFWLRGRTRFQFNGRSDKLRACISAKDNRQFAVWVYPIPVWALRQHADKLTNALYPSHTSAIAFTDYSGVAKALINRHSSQILTSPVEAFSHQEKIDIAEQCDQLIKEFNQKQNGGVTKTEGKRNISIGKIRQYSKSYLINLGFNPLLVDALDWNLPNSRKPAMHYYTNHLWQKPKNSADGIQYHLANRTAMFDRQFKQALPGVGDHTIGAAGLVNPDIVTDFIHLLVEKIGGSPKAITNKKEVDEFITAMNAYSFYMALWFCIETSHRPHHIPFGDVNLIDPMHGLIMLKDKSDSEGGKFRLAWLSKLLRIQMNDYVQAVSSVTSWAAQQDIEIEYGPLIYLEISKSSSKHFSIKSFNSSIFAFKIKDEIKIEENFYRKLMSSLLREGEAPVSTEDVERWLGHWTIGTAPYHLFSSASTLSFVERMEEKVYSVVKKVGFMPLKFILPSPVRSIEEALDKLVSNNG